MSSNKTSTVRKLIKICVQQKLFNEDKKDKEKATKKYKNRQSPWDKERINSGQNDKI
jgi:hypothetical protein